MTVLLDAPVTRPESAREALLRIENLVVDYWTERGPARAVDHVSFSINRGEVFGLAGESGCGKSTIAHTIMRLIKPPGEIVSGSLVFDGQEILGQSKHELRDFRWREVSLISQSAMNALNPVISLGAQLRDAIEAHERVSRRAAHARAAKLFKLVGIDAQRLSSYPHELSGGMRQRAVIAMALALNPKLIIMDEPTTALDVVVQRDILQEIEKLRESFGFSILFITHDLSLLVEFAERVGIMYAGKLVELAPSEVILNDPFHPYTSGLMNSFPSIVGERRVLQGIPGNPPDLVQPPTGCRFHARCPKCLADGSELYRLQTTVDPTLREVTPNHWVACHLYAPEARSG